MDRRTAENWAGGGIRAALAIHPPRSHSQPDSPLFTLGVTVSSGFGGPGSEGTSGRSPGEMNSFFCSPYFRTWTLG